MDYKFEVKDQEEQVTLSIRTRSSVDSLPQVIGEKYGEIMGYLNEIGKKPMDVPFVAYYNMDMEDLDVEIGFPVEKPFPAKREIKASQIPAGKQVSCMHKGPYKEMEPVYIAMMKWIDDSEYTATGTVYEFYYNSPNDVPESELVTKIVFPLK